VAADSVTIGQVSRGQFDDDVAVRTVVTPAKTVYLDAVAGGRVQRVLVEDGQLVAAGQPIAELSNATLQLDVLTRETQVAEQMNLLRSQELNLERGRLDARLRVSELELRERQLADSVGQQRVLAASGFVHGAALRRGEDELDSTRRALDLARDNLRATETLQAAQLAQMRTSAKQLESHLQLAREHLNALQVRAPVAGLLTAFTLEMGQNVERGARVGQIDSPAEFKLAGALDQFYLPRLAPGLAGVVDAGGRQWPVRVGKLYTQVQNGEVRADLEFTSGVPPGLARGQAVNARLVLGASLPALLLPVGPYLQHSAGVYACVLDASGAAAERRAVRLGRRNTRFVEVIDGLAAGERVVTSSYASYAEREVLQFDGAAVVAPAVQPPK
jgi:HlyD family secretion protein